MVISFLIAVFFFINGKLDTPLVTIAGHWQLVLGVVITTFGWIIVTLLTQPTNAKTLATFNALIFGDESKFKGFGNKTISFFCGVFGVYALLFSIGSFIYSDTLKGFVLLIVTTVLGFIIFKLNKN